MIEENVGSRRCLTSPEHKFEEYTAIRGENSYRFSDLKCSRVIVKRHLPFQHSA